MILLFCSIASLTQSQNIQTKEVQVRNGLNQVRTEIFIEQKKVRIDNQVFYYWFKAREIHFTQGGYEGNLLNGNFSEFYPSEQLKEKGQFKNGLKVGQWKSWHENGFIKEISNWKDGYLTGNSKTYDENGKLIYEVNYRKNKLDF